MFSIIPTFYNNVEYDSSDYIKVCIITIKKDKLVNNDICSKYNEPILNNSRILLKHKNN